MAFAARNRPAGSSAAPRTIASASATAASGDVDSRRRTAVPEARRSVRSAELVRFGEGTNDEDAATSLVITTPAEDGSSNSTTSHNVASAGRNAVATASGIVRRDRRRGTGQQWQGTVA